MSKINKTKNGGSVKRRKSRIPNKIEINVTVVDQAKISKLFDKRWKVILEMKKTEEQWESYCKWKGCACIPLWKIRQLYANLPLALREYCYLNSIRLRRTQKLSLMEIKI